MIWFLRALFTVVLGSMLWVTIWASLHVSLFDIPSSVASHPWFIATLFDTYWAFVTFYLWLAYKETAWISRGLWFVAIMLLGNIAMALYCLILLWRAPHHASVEQVFRRDDHRVAWWVPASLIGAIASVGFLARAFLLQPRRRPPPRAPPFGAAGSSRRSWPN
jgi:hypothetical protein